MKTGSIFTVFMLSKKPESFYLSFSSKKCCLEAFFVKSDWKWIERQTESDLTTEKTFSCQITTDRILTSYCLQVVKLKPEKIIYIFEQSKELHEAFLDTLECQIKYWKHFTSHKNVKLKPEVFYCLWILKNAP